MGNQAAFEGYVNAFYRVILHHRSVVHLKTWPCCRTTTGDAALGRQDYNVVLLFCPYISREIWIKS